MGHRRITSQGRKGFGSLAKRAQRKRKSWSFERLEDRLVFSVDPLASLQSLQGVSYSSDNPDGAKLTALDEMYRAQLAAANSTGVANNLFMSVPTNDPMFPYQWHLQNTGISQNVGTSATQPIHGIAGEDINVLPAWGQVDADGNPIWGTGVLVGVIDSGVQLFHPDLSSNISATLRYNGNDGSSLVNPSLTDFESGHGTSVAGIIGAVRDNGQGGVGVAPGVTIVPIKVGDAFGISDASIEAAIRYSLQHGVDLNNLSLGPGNGRAANPLPASLIDALRQSVLNGRVGVDHNGNTVPLGMINVFASGNDAAPGGQGGNYGSASYNGFLNTRYTIGVTGTDENGLYYNTDGTFTNYPVAGPSVLVAAPTGSNSITVGNDTGIGSGIWTTDLTGDNGFNAAPLPNGFDQDQDPWPDPDYTTRFNGTSAAAPMVSGVIALMLQANPHLTFRDVEEILLRSSRQNARYETPSTGVGASVTGTNTWQTNQIGPFRNPDRHINFGGIASLWVDSQTAIAFPLADPSSKGTVNIDLDTPGSQNGFFAPDTNDRFRQNLATYEPQPALFTNGAGFTVSQGYGKDGESIGYAHGTVDAAEAVYMAQHWNDFNQYVPNELTFTTSVVSGSVVLPPAQPVITPGGTFILVPGGIDGDPYIGYWNQYFATPPFNPPYTGPFEPDRGLSYIDFAVPPSQEMDVEYVEVKADINGDTNGLRFMLTSPDGTQSELSDYYPNVDSRFRQPSSDLGLRINPTLPGGGSLSWTFATNRNWGENSSSEVLIHPVTGEPVMQTADVTVGGQQVSTELPIFRNWELHIENWGALTTSVSNIEVIWHGKPISGGKYDPNYGVATGATPTDLKFGNGIMSAQRVQGFIGIDADGNNLFNYSRTVQTLEGQHNDVHDIRDGDVVRRLDFNDNNHDGIYDEGDTVTPDKFAQNIVVKAFRVWNDVAEADPVATYLTGADGNYYFDLDVQGDLALRTQVINTPGGPVNGPHFGQKLEYKITATDQQGLDTLGHQRILLDDTATTNLITSDPGNLTYVPHYSSQWLINPNWFFAPDRDPADVNNPSALGDNPGEILYDPTGTQLASHLVNPTDLPEPGLKAPIPFSNDLQLDHIVPMGVKNLNFLIKDAAPLSTFDITGTVWSDVNGDGAVNGTDAGAGGQIVYWDVHGDGFDATDPQTLTNLDGSYTLQVDLTKLFPVPTTTADYRIGVKIPAGWTASDPGHDGIEIVSAAPGSHQHQDFFLQPPPANPNGGSGTGTIQGIVFNDLNGNGTQDGGESGVPGFTVFLDSSAVPAHFHDGVFQAGEEPSVVTGPAGTYFFNHVDAGVYWVDIVIPNEGTPAANWKLISPSVALGGHREVQVFEGGSLTSVNFALQNLADHDWGDLPDTFQTTSASNGPSHKVEPGFRLGNTIDGEVNGVPSNTATSDLDDDGVTVVSNGGQLELGDNTLHVVVFGVGGFLTGWMDFNNDGTFDGSEQLTWTLNGSSLGQDAALNPGAYDLHITVPAGTVSQRPIASRFRWGEEGLSFTGPAQIGEVEDYFFNLNYLLGDANRDGKVDAGDLVVFNKTKGQTVTPFSGADFNGDGVITDADKAIINAHFGDMLPAPAAGAIMSVASDTSSNTSSASASSLESEYSALLDGSRGAASGQSFGFYSLPAAIPPTKPADTIVSSTTTVSSSASVDDRPLVAAFSMDASQPVSAASTDTTFVQTTASPASSDSNLLLLDQAWANVDGTSYDHADESLYSDQSHECDSANDLALAAVLTEDENWWNAI
jgi:hypothetical protein